MANLNNSEKFNKEESEASDDAEFAKQFCAPGLRYLSITCVIVYFAYGIFWVADFAVGQKGALGGVQTFRLIVIAIAALTHLTVLLKREFAQERYNTVAGIFYLFIAQATAYSAFLSRINAGPSELYWSLTASVVTATLVLYGFGRLTLSVSLWIGGSTALATILYALQVNVVPLDLLTRVVVHLSIVNFVGYLLLRSLISREQSLFTLAKENLSANKYAKELKEYAEALVEQRERANAANVAKDRFLATMSHEIRTPMNAIVGALKLLPLYVQEPMSRATELITVTQRSSEALLGVLNDVIDFARISKSGVSLAPGEFEVNRLIKASVGVFETMARQKGLQLTFDAVNLPNEITLSADQQKIRQIILNLVSNAIKFTDKGFVRVTATTVPLQVGKADLKLVVEDSGIGIPDTFIPHLFEPFTQADGTDTRQVGGTGLGLAIVNDLIKALEGRINYTTSQTGTCFEISIPVQILGWSNKTKSAKSNTIDLTKASGRLDEELNIAEPTLEEVLVPAETTTNGSLRVLIVDDNRVNAQVTGYMLEELGFEHDYAEDGMVGVATFKSSGRYDLVLMDCQMPRMDGFAATREIRKYEKNTLRRKTPIVALTANVLPEVREKCFDAGMDGVLTKPVDPEMLGQVIKTQIEYSKASDINSRSQLQKPSVP